MPLATLKRKTIFRQVVYYLDNNFQKSNKFLISLMNCDSFKKTISGNDLIKAIKLAQKYKLPNEEKLKKIQQEQNALVNQLHPDQLVIKCQDYPNMVINNETDQTILMWAAENRQNELVEALIEAGADINTTSIQKMTALNYAINANNLDAIKLFIENGIDPDTVIDKYETTLFMWAARNGHNDLVEALIKAGADINKKTKMVKVL